jgi:hypothetical protein
MANMAATMNHVSASGHNTSYTDFVRNPLLSIISTMCHILLHLISHWLVLALPIKLHRGHYAQRAAQTRPQAELTMVKEMVAWWAPDIASIMLITLTNVNVMDGVPCQFLLSSCHRRSQRYNTMAKEQRVWDRNATHR